MQSAPPLLIATVHTPRGFALWHPRRSEIEIMSPATLLIGLIWGLLVLWSFAAMGRLLARLVGVNCHREIWLPAGWGMAGMTVLGGWLNLFGIARASVLVALVVGTVIVGTLSEVKTVFRPRRRDESPDQASTDQRSERGSWVWVALLAALIGLKYVLSLGVPFNRMDDKMAYLYLVARLLETGSIGLDPFSNRQLFSLNSQSFLLGLMCSGSSLQLSHLLDPGIGWIVIGGSTWSIVRKELGGSTKQAVALAALVLMVGPTYSLNLSGSLTGAVLYLTAVRTALRFTVDAANLDRGPMVLLALALGGLCSVKSTFLLFGFFFVACWYGLRMLHLPRLALSREALAVGLLVFLFLLPWMCHQYRSGGTLLYPVFGKGYHLSGRGLVPAEGAGLPLKTRLASTRQFVASGQVMPVLMALVLLAANPIIAHAARWRVLLASTLGVVAVSVMLAFQVCAQGLALRYTEPILYATLILAGLYGLFGKRNSPAGIGLSLCLAAFVGNQWHNLQESYVLTREFKNSGLYGNLCTELDAQTIRDMQASVPPGKRMLVSLENGFLLDFSRNPTWNLDVPGMVSPPPGMPITDDPTALRELLTWKKPLNRWVLSPDDLPPGCSGDRLPTYLQQVGVDYVAFPRRESIWYLWQRDIPLEPLWIRTVMAVSKMVHGELLTLIDKCDVVYDVGDFIVLDVRRSRRPRGRATAAVADSSQRGQNAWILAPNTASGKGCGISERHISRCDPRAAAGSRTIPDKNSTFGNRPP